MSSRIPVRDVTTRSFESTRSHGTGSADLSPVCAALTDSVWMIGKKKKKQKCISQSSEVRKVQDQGAGRLGVRCGTLVSACKTVSSIQGHCPHTAEEQRRKPAPRTFLEWR